MNAIMLFKEHLMKRILLSVISLILIAACCGLSSCVPVGTSSEIKPKEELEFVSNGDGTCTLSGKGDFSGETLVIPTHSPAGDLVTSIGARAFAECKDIKRLEFAEGSKCEGIGERAFENCSGLAEITLPQGLKKIDIYAFIYCTGLKRASLPESVSEIGSSAFSYCTSLGSISFGGTREQWNGVSKGYYWYYSTISCVITCSDGELSV